MNAGANMPTITHDLAVCPGSPGLITAVTGDGPVMALDLATVPREILERITARALNVAAAWDDCFISTEYLRGKAALECLSYAANELDQHFLPLVPRARDLAAAFDAEGQTFPIVRDGEIVWIAQTQLSALELAAVRAWLRLNMAAATEQSTIFRLRLEQFERESLAHRSLQPNQI